MHSVNVLIKPASGACNLRCKYCFYADEAMNRSVANYGMMSMETIEAVVARAMESAERAVTFGFQGGEPTLCGLDFYCAEARLVIELDGSQHYEEEGRAADERRDAYLNALGLTVVRYSNRDIRRNFNGVCEDIMKRILLK